MSYADVIRFLSKTTEEKTVLIEMDLGKKQERFWYNHCAFVWAYKWRLGEYIKDIGDGNIGDGTIGAGDLKDFIKVGSCFAGGIEYVEDTSLADLIKADHTKRWYYDAAASTFYIHCINNEEPQIYYPIIGITLGLSNKDGYHNDLYYEPRLKSVMTISKSKDPFFFGLIRFDGGEMTFINSDGFFDGIKANVITGQPVITKFGGDDLDYSDYQLINKSYIEDLRLTHNEMSLVVIDNRKKLSVSLPLNKFNKSSYPNLSDDDIGKSIPLGYGEIYHAPVVCVNADLPGYQECGLSGKTGGTATGLSTTTNYYFKLTIDEKDEKEYKITTADDVTYTAVMALMNDKISKAVFSLVGGDLRCTSEETSAITLGLGTTGADLFDTLTDFSAFEDPEPDRIFAVCDIANHTNGINDIIQLYKVTDEKPESVSSFTKQLVGETYGDIATVTIESIDWNSSKKYICDYEGVKSSLGVYLQNPLDIIRDMLEVFLLIIYNAANYNTTEWAVATAHSLANDIGLLINSSRELTNIIEEICNCLGSFIIQDNGKFTFRILDVDELPSNTLYMDDMIAPFDIEWEGTEFISSANIGYKRNWNKNGEDAYRWYLKDDLRDAIYSEYKRYNDKDFSTLLTNEADAIECAAYMMDLFKEIPAIYAVRTKTNAMKADIMDMMVFQLNRVEVPWLDYVKVSIINIVKDLISNTVELIGQHIVSYPPGPFIYYRYSPYAINVDKIARGLKEIALTYGRWSKQWPLE